LIEESAGLDDNDVTELLGLSRNAAEDGISTKSETQILLKNAKGAMQPIDSEREVNEDDVAALLRQLGEEKDTAAPEETENSTDRNPDESAENTGEADDSAEIAAILSQLTDAARLEQQFDDTDSQANTPTISHLSLPSVPTTTTSEEDDLSARLANLKSFKPATPKNYTGTDLGSINVFVPGLAKTQEDESEHWCGNDLHGSAHSRNL